ncbi:MAG: hypothetical protein K9K67_11670 [Bacteriovoracaceae bacterium]|nr:hypothetical protein [Bacteriovoracaceae bacterium]
MKKVIFLLSLIFLMAFMPSCSSLGEKVLARMDGISDRPEWASLSKTTFTKEGKIMVVGYAEVQADAQIGAAMKLSDNNARFEISRRITNDMGFIFQNLKEGVLDGGDLSRFYGMEISKTLSSDTVTEKRYWEKVETFDSYGEKIYKLRLYSLVSIKESSLRKAIARANAKQSEISPELKKEITDHLQSEIRKLQGS